MNDKTLPLHDMEVLLPPANIEGDYLSGWVEGQSYLILNYGTDEAFEAATKTCDTIEAQATHIEALKAALRRIKDATDNELRAGDKGYVSRYGIHGIATKALEGKGND